MTLIVDGNCNKLKDTFIIDVNGAKNAILPLMITKILVPDKTIFTNVPTECEDVKTMVEILSCLGIMCEVDKKTLTINNQGITSINIPIELATKTRYSSLLLGALGGLKYNFKIPFPGGCSLQEKRPLDIHYACLKKIGYIVEEDKNYIKCKPIDSYNMNTSIF